MEFKKISKICPDIQCTNEKNVFVPTSKLKSTICDCLIETQTKTEQMQNYLYQEPKKIIVLLNCYVDYLLQLPIVKYCKDGPKCKFNE